MPASATPSSLTIVVVDDESAIREMLAWLLEEAGHRVQCFDNAAAALEHLRAEGPADVVLSDINMPGMSGLELQQQIAAGWPSLPVLLTSGRPPPGGTRSFLAKPFRWDALVEALRAAAPGGMQVHAA